MTCDPGASPCWITGEGWKHSTQVRHPYFMYSPVQKSDPIYTNHTCHSKGPWFKTGPSVRVRWRLHQHCWHWVVFPPEKPISRHVLWFLKGFSHVNTKVVSQIFLSETLFVFPWEKPFGNHKMCLLMGFSRGNTTRRQQCKGMVFLNSCQVYICLCPKSFTNEQAKLSGPCHTWRQDEQLSGLPVYSDGRSSRKM